MLTQYLEGDFHWCKPIIWGRAEKAPASRYPRKLFRNLQEVIECVAHEYTFDKINIWIFCYQRIEFLKYDVNAFLKVATELILKHNVCKETVWYNKKTAVTVKKSVFPVKIFFFFLTFICNNEAMKYTTLFPIR